MIFNKFINEELASSTEVQSATFKDISKTST